MRIFQNMEILQQIPMQITTPSPTDELINAKHGQVFLASQQCDSLSGHTATNSIPSPPLTLQYQCGTDGKVSLYLMCLYSFQNCFYEKFGVLIYTNYLSHFRVKLILWQVLQACIQTTRHTAMANLVVQYTRYVQATEI